MKRYAKNVNILDLDFIEICIADCLRKKWKRKDVCIYFCSLLKISKAKLDDKRFIDIMGFRIYKTHITIRRRVFLRIRRAYKRARKYRNSVRLARKCNSYKGHILHTDSLKFAKRYHVYDSARRARRLISNASKIRQRAA